MNKRILIVDDLVSIQEDFKKILSAPLTTLATVPGLADFAPQLVRGEPARSHYPLAFASQGDEALLAVEAAEAAGSPFAAAFLDVRMPPGIDGVETAEKLLARHPRLQVALCTAYTDYSFAELSTRFAENPNLLIMKKPFDPAEVLQVACMLTDRWALLERQRGLSAVVQAAVPTLAKLSAQHPELRGLLSRLEGI